MYLFISFKRVLLNSSGCLKATKVKLWGTKDLQESSRLGSKTELKIDANLGLACSCFEQPGLLQEQCRGYNANCLSLSAEHHVMSFIVGTRKSSRHIYLPGMDRRPHQIARQ